LARIKLTLGYDGSRFNGFQIQKESPKLKTVAGTITKALRKINIDTTLVGSGRTDSGVHAVAQVAHLDVPAYWEDIEKLKIKLNKMIEPHIYIKKIELVDESFHARFGAKKRLYRYILHKGTYNLFYEPYTLHVKNLDTKKLNIALKHFIGIHNFEYFRKRGSESKTDIREIFDAGAYEYKDFCIIYFYGSSFLRSQVRMMSDFALKVAQDKLSLAELQEQLQKEKKHSTSLVKPNGLYLAKIYY
jgi:tRNA pseudouridine38-40 synthase